MSKGPAIPQSVFDVHYRPATRLDGGPAGRLMYSAAPVAFDYVFGRAAAEFLEFSFRRGRSEFGWRCHRVAVMRGQVVGLIGFSAGNGYIRTSIYNSLDILAFYGWLKGLSVLWRGLKMLKLIPPPGLNRLLIGHVAVNKKYRGRGIASTMMQAIGSDPIAGKNYRQILDVAVDNPGAQALYEHLGFQTVMERSVSLVAFTGERVPAHRRMEKR